MPRPMIRGAARTDTLVLEIQAAAILNTLRAAWRTRPLHLAIVGGIAALMLVSQALSGFQALADCAACRGAVQRQPGSWLCAGLLAAMAGGIASGRLFAAWNRGTARASWLAALPWSSAARARAIRRANTVYAAVSSGLLLLPAWGVAKALQPHTWHPQALAPQALAPHALPPQALHLQALAPQSLPFGHHAAPLCAGLAAAWAASFLAGARLTSPGPPADGPAHGHATSRTSRFPLAFLDRPAPAHAGRWAWAGAMRVIAAAWVMALLPLGGAAAAVSLAHHQAAPAFGTAALGANLIFVMAVRCRPLASPVFRAAPLSFARAAGALFRAPLAASLAWFAAAAAIPLAACAAAWRMLPGFMAGLLVLNALYAASALFRPQSPRQALLLYGGALYALLYETATAGMAYGVLTLAAVSGIALLLCRQARATYRAGHG